MSNLPRDTNQPPVSPSEPNTQGPSLKGSEGGIFPESPPQAETAPSRETHASTETLKLQEKVAPPTPKPSKEKPKPEAPKDTIGEDSNRPPVVVDKTDQITSLHEIKKPMDKLTEEADDEEERFIEEVEKQHGHL